MTEPTRHEPTHGPGSREEGLPRALWVRLIIYIAAGHVLAAFIYLLFEVGASGR